METNKPEANQASGVIDAPVLTEQSPAMSEDSPPFEASAWEIIAAFLTYAALYAFVRLCQMGPFVEPPERTFSLVVGGLGLFYIGLVELVNRGRRRLKESWVWLGCYAAALAGIAFWRLEVWDETQHSLFLFIFGIWWALSRGGALLERQSGRLLPLDAANGFLLFPFRHFFLRARTAGYALARLWRKRLRPMLRRGEGPVSAAALAWTAGAILMAGGLFAAAGCLLSAADEGFAGMMRGAAGLFRIRVSVDAVNALRLSLPLGAYLFGAAAGPGRESRPRLRAQADRVDALWARLRQVPPVAWTALMAAFALLYALFFAVQGSYLFGAFTRTLPAGFIVSEYARRGFFELCGVMAVNFALLWLAVRLSAAPVRENRPLLAACLLLLGESALLAVVALSKLGLYIDCFGFTPLRLQSSWLACVLLFGCGCAAASLLTGRKTFRAWMFFGAATLAALCLY